MSIRTSVSLGFADMFSGWSSVDSHRDDARRQYVVRLTLDESELDSMMGPAQLVDRLWPRRVVLPRRFGVRFHGRIVGKAR